LASTDLQHEGGVFVTAFLGVLDLDTGEVAYASAGHDAPFILGGKNLLRQLTTVGGPPLGALDTFLYPIDRDRIRPGEVLLLYTDGVTEAENADRALYGRNRLAETLAKVPTGDIRKLVGAIFDDVRRFVGKAEQADDLTVLALRRADDAGGPIGQ
jgi:serine phosphatase RsbU (regulator of sigma subunit)